MSIKVCPVCPACKAPHNEEVEPGTKITCPDCDQVYRAAAPEPSDPITRPRDRSGAGRKPAPEPAAKKPKKKAPARSADNLGKLIERFGADRKRAVLLAVAIIAAVVAIGGVVFAFVGVDADTQPFVLGGAGVPLLVTVVCLLKLRFGGLDAFFEIRKKGVRYKTRRNDQYLFWDEIESIDIQRVVGNPGRRAGMKYEVILVGSETIHLTSAFLAKLDDPRALIKALKAHSGRDFETAVG